MLIDNKAKRQKKNIKPIHLFFKIEVIVLGQPFANIISYNEGFVNESTGVLYFFITDMDQSMQDIKAHNYTSLSFSEYQTDYCTDQKFDPEDPRCARLVLSGTWSRVPKVFYQIYSYSFGDHFLL